ncbi:beta-hydroxyacyl-ACP dehydratase [Morganella morganii]|nr:beta-hydroxyacyl-ACP dehydratase [Morganella morganii]
MVDRIIDFQPGEYGCITVIKHVTFNDSFLQGHFPDDPVMPGIMIAEIFGQASEYLSFIDDFCNIYNKRKNILLNRFSDISKAMSEPESLSTLISHRNKVNGVLVSQNIKYKNSVYPGDTIEVRSKLLLSDPDSFKHYNVEARVGKKLVAAGTIVNYRKQVIT